MGSLLKGSLLLPSLPCTCCLHVNPVTSELHCLRWGCPMSGWPCRCSTAGRVPAKHKKSLLPFLSGRSTQLTLTVWLPCRHHIPPPRRLGRSHIGTHTHTCKAGIWQRRARHSGWVGNTARVSSTPQKVGYTLLSDSGEPYHLPYTGSHIRCCRGLG